MTDEQSLEAFERFEFTDPEGRWTRPVYRRGAGPAVIVIHEMPGLHPLVLRFASRVAEAGMTVFCPHLFGEAGKPVRPLTAPARSSTGCAHWRGRSTPSAAGAASARSACASPATSRWR
jgi:dienelactone hydrolase